MSRRHARRHAPRHGRRHAKRKVLFDINIHNSKSHKTGYQVQLRFRVSKNERDIQLMELLKKYLGSGTIEINKKISVNVNYN
jgi:LAGLIDADG endonuclease